MCNRCLMEEECVCLKEAIARADSAEGIEFIRDFLDTKRNSRKSAQ